MHESVCEYDKEYIIPDDDDDDEDGGEGQRGAFGEASLCVQTAEYSAGINTQSRTLPLPLQAPYNEPIRRRSKCSAKLLLSD